MQLWSHARYDLKLSSDEFHALTPHQFDILLRRHQRKIESIEVLFAQLTSWVANTGFRSTEKPTDIRDFMPSEWTKKTKPARKRRRSARAISDELGRVMDQLANYQAAQVKRGIRG